MSAPKCACGCGQTLYRNARGKMPKLSPGHKIRRPNCADAVREFVVSNGVVRHGEVVHALLDRYAESTIHSALWDLKHSGDLHCKQGMGWAHVSVEIPDSPRHSAEVVGCRCGCGTEILRFDDWGRERFWAPGHHRKKARA